MATKAGQLRHRLEILAPSPPESGQNAYGEPSPYYTGTATVWAKITPALAGRKFMYGNKPAAEHSHEIEIRYRDGLTVAHRFRLGTRVFGIVWIADPDEINERLLIGALELKPDPVTG